MACLKLFFLQKIVFQFDHINWNSHLLSLVTASITFVQDIDNAVNSYNWRRKISMF